MKAQMAAIEIVQKTMGGAGPAARLSPRATRQENTTAISPNPAKTGG